MVSTQRTRSNALALARWEGEGGATGQPATQEVESQRPAKETEGGDNHADQTSQCVASSDGMDSSFLS